MSEAQVRQPLFGRLYTLMTRAEPAELRDRRRELGDGLSGWVLEVGAGTGLTFPFIRPRSMSSWPSNPRPTSGTGREADAQAPVPVTVVDGTAEHLPASPAS
jgi:hypothetical protein